ncbi:DUF3953 domain-containing protein [Bacillus manliponensis]|uniref:DUF3953 domain-containing protein n=1 Tax=Bacillus manliponensis TaxID=574376 RepID=UPI003513942F
MWRTLRIILSVLICAIALYSIYFANHSFFIVTQILIGFVFVIIGIEHIQQRKMDGGFYCIFGALFLTGVLITKLFF